jgi:hypothetical protein
MAENQAITVDTTKSAKERLEAEKKLLEIESARLKIQVDLKNNEGLLSDAITEATNALNARTIATQKQIDQARADIPLLESELDIFRELEAIEESAGQKLIARNKIRELEAQLD